MASSCENKSTLLISKTKVNCFFCGVINCGKGNRRVSAFLVPKEKFQNWQQTFPRLKIGNKICDIHFDAEDIINGVTIGNQFYPYKCKKLGVNAIPKHFLSCKNTKEEKRKPLSLKESNSIVISKPVGKTSHCGPRQEHSIAPKTKTTRKETIQPDIVVEKHISPQHGGNTHAHYMPQVRDTPFDSTKQLHCEEELNVTMSDVLLYPDFRDCGKEFAHSPPTQIEIVHPSAEEQSLSLTFYDIENAVMGTTNSQDLQSVCDPGIQMDNSISGPRNPDTPLSLQVVNITHDCITLSWRQGFNGGLSQKYRIRYSQLGAEFIWYTDVFPTNETTFKVDRLKIGTEYQFSIMSFNDFGESDYSENIKAITNYSRERKTLHYKKSINLRAARNSCHICNKYVSFTRKNLRTTKKIVCASCLPKLTTLERRLGTIQQKLRKTRQHLTRTKRELYRSSKAVKDANLNINALEKEVKNLKKQTLESIISVLPPKQQTIIKTFVLKHKVEMKSKTNRAHGMKYDSNFLMQALLIKMKSSKAYRHIREEGLLPKIVEVC